MNGIAAVFYQTFYRHDDDRPRHHHSDICHDESDTRLAFNEERGTNEAVQRNLESYYHLNEPLITQYAIYLKSILTFDFGPSIKNRQTV